MLKTVVKLWFFTSWLRRGVGNWFETVVKCTFWGGLVPRGADFYLVCLCFLSVFSLCLCFLSVCFLSVFSVFSLCVFCVCCLCVFSLCFLCVLSLCFLCVCVCVFSVCVCQTLYLREINTLLQADSPTWGPACPCNNSKNRGQEHLD